MGSVAFPSLSLAFPTFCIWGSNTGVGKTLVAAGIAAACKRASVPLMYIKPLQTGFPQDADGQLVASAGDFTHSCGEHASYLHPKDVVRNNTQSCSKTLFAWSAPVSPHIAAHQEGRGVTDAQVLQLLARTLASSTARLNLIETAGGVGSPGPNGTLQSSLLRPFRFPALLVGDGRLGGISATLSSYEFLKNRGYDVPFIIIPEHEDLGNSSIIQKELERESTTRIMCVPQLPQNKPSLAHHDGRMNGSTLPLKSVPKLLEDGGSLVGFQDDEELQSWLSSSSSAFDAIIPLLQEWHTTRVTSLARMGAHAQRVLWWPFTQHASSTLSNHGITALDARAGEHFISYDRDTNALEPLYDGCASWWTQGIGAGNEHGLASAVSHAVGRYGHVMFPENAHEPAVRVADLLLSSVGSGWATRVFYSDNGSTAIEVALKMAFRKYIQDHDINDSTDVVVLGIQEGYHGDTLGAMDAVSPSVFNGRLQTPWYSGRGLFLNAPLLHDKQRSSELKTCYGTEHFHNIIDGYESNSRKIGALILEPVMQGAGGMRIIDPAWQAALAKACKERGIPVIFDEVFTGLYRLGRLSGAEIVGVKPDIACYAKLLTGGVVPLAVTLTSEDFFEAFLSADRKEQALLHGHSYTAHPIGCCAARFSLETYLDQQVNSNLLPNGQLQSLWSVSEVERIGVKLGAIRATAVGTVLAFDFGEEVNKARALAWGLRKNHGTFARPLGGVAYLMVTPLTSPKTCKHLLEKLEMYTETVPQSPNKKIVIVSDASFS